MGILFTTKYTVLWLNPGPGLNGKLRRPMIGNIFISNLQLLFPKEDKKRIQKSYKLPSKLFAPRVEEDEKAARRAAHQVVVEGKRRVDRRNNPQCYAKPARK